MKHTEDAEQVALMTWAKSHVGGVRVSDYLIHIPNGGKRNAREAARLKQMGVKAGVSDMFLPVPRGQAHGLWVEMKASKGRVSDAQRDWLTKVGAQGYATAVCYGHEAARRAITAYLETQ